MIGKHIDKARHLVEQFSELIDFAAFDIKIREEFDALAATATDERFPGALLSLPRTGKSSVYYAVASEEAEWRRLRPLLISYVGPTLTSFQGWPEPLLPHALPAEALLHNAGLHVVARIVPGDETKVQAFARRSLLRMVTMVTNAPSTTTSVPQSTDRLLAHFSDYLNGNDYEGANQILLQCEHEMRIDALNLLFLRVRLLAWFGNWHALANMPEFRALCHTRRPSAVNGAMLEAVYQVWSRDQTDISALEDLWTSTLRSDFLGLLLLPILPGCSLGALTLYAVEALSVEIRNVPLETAVIEHQDLIPELVSALRATGRAGTQYDVQIREAGRGVPAAQHALVKADRTNTLETIAHALQVIDELNAAERQALLDSVTFRSLWRGLSTENGKAPPTSWQEWFKRLQDPDFVDALQVLEHAVVEWPAASLIDPVDVANFEHSLQTVPDGTLASDRLADSLPVLVTWTLEDPAFPRPAMLAVYDTLLFHLMVGARRSNAVFESAAVMIRASLSLGLSQSRYRALLDDCLMLTGEAMSKRTVYWLLDMLEETLLNICMDEEARRSFWYAACARLMQMKAFFSPGQRIVFDKLSKELGWPEAREIEERTTQATGDNQRKQFQAALEGNFIAIYTLTESAARQAANVLKELVPSMRVEISNDKAASTALRHMAQQADIFVMVTASAKHAATGFIQQERRDKPILFANGRGLSSIMRAIESHLLGMGQG